MPGALFVVEVMPCVNSCQRDGARNAEPTARFRLRKFLVKICLSWFEIGCRCFQTNPEHLPGKQRLGRQPRSIPVSQNSQVQVRHTPVISVMFHIPLPRLLPVILPSIHIPSLRRR